ncbi:MAG: TRAP transporter substrate-binding protein [Oceanospirillaceae bacterium]|jgi:C4-dicarboxylate-binding protein DctP|nr:TRAP transporter substrate-binding protein [Oceanospirillaceae bacterium]
MKTLLTTILASAIMVTSGQAMANCDDGELVIKFSHVTNTDKHPKGIAASLLEKRVNEEMNGTACMQVFPNSTLYDDKKVLEALLNGDVQLAAPSLSKFEKYTKKFRIFDLPFLFENVDAVDRFQNSETGQNLKDSMQRRGLQGLTFWHNGMKQMSANKPLIHPNDAQGLKFRVMASDVLVAQFEQLGANPQKMSFKEVYGGLQTKVIDGQENSWSNIYGKKFFEVQDGTTETNHGILDYLVVTSSEFWEGMDADTRDQFAQILREVTETRNAASYEVNQMNQEAIVKSGGVVRTLTNEQRQAWVNAMKPVWKKFEDDIGADLIEAAIQSNN